MLSCVQEKLTPLQHHHHAKSDVCTCACTHKGRQADWRAQTPQRHMPHMPSTYSLAVFRRAVRVPHPLSLRGVCQTMCLILSFHYTH